MNGQDLESLNMYVIISEYTVQDGGDHSFHGVYDTEESANEAFDTLCSKLNSIYETELKDYEEYLKIERVEKSTYVIPKEHYIDSIGVRIHLYKPEINEIFHSLAGYWHTEQQVRSNPIRTYSIEI